MAITNLFAHDVGDSYHQHMSNPTRCPALPYYRNCSGHAEVLPAKCRMAAPFIHCKVA